MAPGNNYLTAGAVYGSSYIVNKYTTVNYGSDWIFDSTLEMSVCSDYGGTNSIECLVQNLKVKYTGYSSSLSVIDFANTVTMLADYKLNEGKLINSQGILGSASLSSPPPVWTSNNGLAFTSASQYIQLPNFIPSASDLTVTTSLAFAFYIKIDTAPSATANIMSYYCTSISGIIFGVQITSSGQLRITQGTSTSVPSTTFTLGQWTMVTVSYSYTYGGNGISIFFLDKETTGPAISGSPLGSATFSSSDRVRFGGGFVGQIQRIQVYSPAGLRLNPEPCDPTTCNLDIGFSIPPTCLNAVCATPATYTSFGSCENCPTGCSACTDPKTCQSCYPNYYLDGTICSKCLQGQYAAISTATSCTDCPNGCSSCTDSQTCQSCNSGYGFVNNLCVICPDGTFLNSNQLCQEFPAAIQDTLEKSQLLTSGATQVSNAISGGSSISLSAAVSGRIFSQIKYLNISYAGELEVALKTWLPSFVSLGLTPNMPQSMLGKIPNRPVPYVFEKYEVPSSFLINFWENLGIVIFATVLWMLCYGVQLIMNSQRKPKIALVVRKIRVFTQNFLISTFFGVYGDLVMFSVIEYRTFAFGWNLSLLSFIVSIIMLIAMFSSFWYQTKLLMNYQKVKQQDQNAPNDSPKLLNKFLQQHEGSSALFSEVKDYSIAPQLFLFFLSGRDLLCSLILATMFHFPIMQTLIITIMDCLMIAYLFAKMPFRSNIDLSKQLFFELIGLIVNICVFLNAALDGGQSKALEIKSHLGKLIIILNMIFNFATAVFMLISIGQLLLEFYRKQIQKRREKIPKNLTIKNRPHEVQNTSQINSSNQSFLHDSMISNSPPLAESADLNLLPKQILLSKRPRILRTNPKGSQRSSLMVKKQDVSDHSTHLEIESNYIDPRQKSNERVDNRKPNLSQNH